jgi:LysR family glycine cleavage system transcriptional activator
MNRRLPPLYPLRSFESAARLNSFTVAATELNVTQSAISHQVKKLESYFGVTLFHRKSSGLLLTAEGKKLFEVTTRAFSSLEEANHRLPNSQVLGSLSISVPPLFFNFWLASRLTRFSETYPGIRLHLMHGIQLSRTEQNEADIAFHWGHEMPPGFTGDRIMSVEYAPAASPRFMAGQPDFRRLESLTGRMLLHETDYEAWDEWFRVAGLTHGPEPTGWVFNDPGMLVETALQGQGIALLPFPLLNDLVAEGKLTRPFGQSIRPAMSYFCGISGRGKQKRQATTFLGWLTRTGDGRRGWTDE